jgi:hypothetical protein
MVVTALIPGACAALVAWMTAARRREERWSWLAWTICSGLGAMTSIGRLTAAGSTWASGVGLALSGTMLILLFHPDSRARFGPPVPSGAPAPDPTRGRHGGRWWPPPGGSSMITALPEHRRRAMTSGQGENEPGGQGWNAPPSPPPYGQPYPGYAPAPSAPTGHGAPTAMERPLTVRAGLGAFVGSTVLSVVAQIVTLLNWETVVEWTLARAALEPGADIETTRAAAEFGAKTGSIVGLLFVAVYGLFVWFAWRGRNWARVVLWVLAGLGLVFGLAGLAVGSPLPFLTALGAFQLLFLAAAVVLLALKPSNEWYRFRRWQRANGQR